MDPAVFNEFKTNMGNTGSNDIWMEKKKEKVSNAYKDAQKAKDFRNLICEKLKIEDPEKNDKDVYVYESEKEKGQWRVAIKPTASQAMAQYNNQIQTMINQAVSGVISRLTKDEEALVQKLLNEVCVNNKTEIIASLIEHFPMLASVLKPGKELLCQWNKEFDEDFGFYELRSKEKSQSNWDKAYVGDPVTLKREDIVKILDLLSALIESEVEKTLLKAAHRTSQEKIQELSKAEKQEGKNIEDSVVSKVDRQEAERILKGVNQNVFLIRSSSTYDLAISIKDGDEIKNYKIHKSDKLGSIMYTTPTMGKNELYLSDIIKNYNEKNFTFIHVIR